MLSLNIIFGKQKKICLFMILQLFYKILQIFCCLSWMTPVLNNSNPDFENTTGHYCDNKNHALQKQPQEVFYAKSCSEKFCNIYRKTPVLASPFNKVAGLQQAFSTEALLKGDSNTGVSCANFLKAPILKNFCEHLLLASCL